MEKHLVISEIDKFMRGKYPHIFTERISYEEVINWFRDKLNLHISINYEDDVLGYSYTITQVEDNEVIVYDKIKKREYKHVGWNFYDAREEAVNECVKLLK